MGNWREFEIKDFRGIAESSRNPAFNEASEILNFDLRGKEGDLTSREGYVLKYSYPTHPKLDSTENLIVKNFTITSFDNKEITLLAQKARVTSESGENLNTLAFWIRPYWNGSTWIDDWKWLNEIQIAKLTAASDLTYNNMVFIQGNYNCNNWVILNKTKNQTAKVISSVVDGLNTRINTTLFNSSWEINDEIILMKTYLPYDFLIELGNVSKKDIVIHNVLDELRIGFGGKPNRYGLSVGYRKNYLNFRDFTFEKHSDITEDVINHFGNVDEIILSPYSILFDKAGLDLSTTANGSFDETGIYSFKVTGVLDDYSEILITDSLSINVESGKALMFIPKIDLGLFNPRLTKLKVYIANSSLVFTFLKEYSLRDSEKRNLDFVCGEEGNLIFALDSAIELHDKSNAASIADTEEVTGWTDGGSKCTISAVSDLGTTGYVLKAENIDVNSFLRAEYLLELEPFSSYILDFFIRGSVEEYNIDVTVAEEDLSTGGLYSYNYKNIIVDSVFRQHTIIISTADRPKGFRFQSESSKFYQQYFLLDKLSIKKDSDSVIRETPSNAEISSVMGYTPTKDLVKSWDHAIVLGGRVHYLNAYIDKRYPNKIFRSHVSGSGAFMYDAATAENYFDVENFDGNEALGMAALPNIDIQIIKNSSTARVNSINGWVSEAEYGKGSTARNSIVDLGNVSIWAGSDGILAKDGVSLQDLTIGTIQSLYRSIIDKSSIFAAIDKTEYRFCSSQDEYLFTKKGWTHFKQFDIPYCYVPDQKNNLLFAGDNGIYELGGHSDNGESITLKWKSILFDTHLLGPELKQSLRFYVNRVWLRCSINSDLTFNVYLDGKLFKSTVFNKTGDYIDLVSNLPVGSNGSYFSVEVLTESTSPVLIHSIGVMWKPMLIKGRSIGVKPVFGGA